MRWINREWQTYQTTSRTANRSVIIRTRGRFARKAGVQSLSRSHKTPAAVQSHPVMSRHPDLQFLPSSPRMHVSYYSPTPPCRALYSCILPQSRPHLYAACVIIKPITVPHLHAAYLCILLQSHYFMPRTVFTYPTTVPHLFNY